jgi:hypothetical protein
VSAAAAAADASNAALSSGNRSGCAERGRMPENYCA